MRFPANMMSNLWHLFNVGLVCCWNCWLKKDFLNKSVSHLDFFIHFLQMFTCPIQSGSFTSNTDQKLLTGNTNLKFKLNGVLGSFSFEEVWDAKKMGFSDPATTKSQNQTTDCQTDPQRLCLLSNWGVFSLRGLSAGLCTAVTAGTSAGGSVGKTSVKWGQDLWPQDDSASVRPPMGVHFILCQQKMDPWIHL